MPQDDPKPNEEPVLIKSPPSFMSLWHLVVELNARRAACIGPLPRSVYLSRPRKRTDSDIDLYYKPSPKSKL